MRVLYDDAAVYIGARLHDTGQIVARLGRRDGALGDSDWFGVMLDSYHDHRTAFGFDVNPAGVRRDEVKTINSNDNSWDAVWDVATSVDSAGWTVEYRIPFSQLRFGRDSAQTWGVQFERVIGRNHEYAVSTFIPKRESGGVPRYGHLTGLRELVPGNRLEILPYTMTRAEYIDPALNPYRTKSEFFASAGVDLRYRMTSNLTLNATLNPDFGQVEVDPAVVNLGVYETFFDEKRPFFLEGREIFAFGGGTSGGQLFYSRRIGKAPSLAPSTTKSDVPKNVTILGAGKLSGKIAGWSLGALGAITAREEARFLDAQDVNQRMGVEPRSEYFAGRARRELRGGRSLLGGVVTAVHRDLDTDAMRGSLRREAYAAGVDVRHEWANRSWVLRGDAQSTIVRGTPSAMVAVQQASNHFFQRPDADHLEVDPNATSLRGYATSLTLGKQGGEHWRGELAGALTSPRYEVNDLGFAQRTDRRDVQGTVTYQENRPGNRLRRWTLSMIGRSEHNYDGQPILTIANLLMYAQTPAYVATHLSVRRQFEAYDDRLTRGGPIAIRPASWNGSLYLSTDARKAVTAEGQIGGERTDAGGWIVTLTPSIGVKTSTSWNLSIGPRLTRIFVPAQYVTSAADAGYAPTFGRRYIFAPLDQTEVGLVTRLNVTFTPLLSFEMYAQPLLSSGDYGAPTQLVAPGTYDFAPYAGTVPNRDFNLRSLRGNAVLRWEWRPGSTMFVAWQQSRSHNDPLASDFRFGRDQRALFDTRPDNIFVVKINYWLNP